MRLNSFMTAFWVFALASTLPAHAVLINQNIKDGLWLQVSGSVAPTVKTESRTVDYIYGDKQAFTTLLGNPSANAKTVQDLLRTTRITHQGTLEDVLAHQDKKENDERARLEGMGLGRLDFIATQTLTRNTKVAGEVILFGDRNGMRPYSLGLRLTNDKLGSMGINSNAIFNNASARPTGTFTTIDAVGSSISASYTQIPNLTVSGYYALPATADTRLMDAHLHGGYGASVSYTKNFAPKHIMAMGVAHTKGERFANIVSNEAFKDKKATAVGVQYQYQDLNVSLDASRSNEDLNGFFVDTVKTKTHGIRFNYQFTPRLSGYAYYGQQKSQKTANSPYSFNFPTFFSELTISAARTNTPMVGINNGLLFDKVEKRMYGVGASYNLYRNINLNSSIAKTDETNYLVDGKFSERESLAYNVGMSFRF